MYSFIYLYHFSKILTYEGGKNGMDECVSAWLILLTGNLTHLIMTHLTYDNVHSRPLMKEQIHWKKGGNTCE